MEFDSSRFADTGNQEILIGREAIENCQNQIRLKKDQNVSRLHGKLDCKDGFPEFTKDRIAFLEFLKINKQKAKSAKNRASLRIPQEIMKCIYSYISDQPEFRLYDLGSLTGTYVKLHYEEKVDLEEEAQFYLGYEVSLVVQHIYQVQINPYCQILSTDTFYKYLLKQIVENNAIVLGLTEEQSEVLELMQISREIYSEDVDYKAIDVNKKYNFPADYIKLDVFSLMMNNQPETTRSVSSIIVLGQADEEFTFGRINEDKCDINIGEFITLSRRHARLYYDIDNMGKSHWFIIDGSEDGPSRNGTWKSLNKRCNQRNRKTSEPFVIRDSEYFRVGNTQLKIEIERNNNTLPKKNSSQDNMEIESPLRF